MKSSVPKPDKSTIDENWVFNIVIQNYIRASNRVNLDPDNSHKYIIFLIKILFSHRHVYKFRQRNLCFSEVPKVDLFDFGT